MKFFDPYRNLPLFIFLIIFVIFVSKFIHIIINPKLEIISPKSEYTPTKEILITGFVDPQSELTINNENVILKEGGSFERNAILKEGLNDLSLEVKNFWGVKKSKKLTIIYREQ
ncbi:MAG: hypothetical protein AAB371_00420 [Patescibacteria group bacterium]